MALQRLYIPNTLPLPVAVLAELTVESPDLEGVQVGGIVNATGASPDGSAVYCVAWGGAAVCEGWVPRDSIRLLGPPEASSVPDSLRLPLRQLLARVTFVEVKDEDWQENDDLALPLSAGEVLQLGGIRNGWGFGWSPERPTRRGWFPLSMVNALEHPLEAFAERRDEELSAGAAVSLVELLKASPPPAPRQWRWEGDLPAVVAESAQRCEREWQDQVAQLEAQEQSLAQDMAVGDVGGEGDLSQQNKDDIFAQETLAEDFYPLAVCKTTFNPPKGAGKALLELQIGDLVRVTSAMDATMCHGFLEKKQAARGWFPKRNIEVVEDPLDANADALPMHIGIPTMPPVPPGLKKFGA